MSQGGGAAAGGAGVPATGGGGGSKFLDILKSVGIPVGLGALASGSPLAAVGVRTGLGAYSMMSENRRQKKLSDLMAEYYGGGSGEKVEGPSNAGDPAFGGKPGTFSTGMTDPGFAGRLTENPSGDRTFGLGGGDRSIDDVFSRPEPGMTAGATLSSNKISELLKKGSQPEKEPGMSRDEYLARLAAGGAITPIQMEQIKAREAAVETSDARYNESKELDAQRYEESTRRYNEGKMTDEERYEDTKAYRERQDRRAEAASERAERTESRLAANSAADNARAERAFEMSVERFEMAKAQWEAGQKLDAKEVSSILNSVTGSLEDLTFQLKFADEADQPALQERMDSLRNMATILQAKLETTLGVGQADAAQPDLIPGHTPGATVSPTATPTPVRRRYNAATGTFE